MFTFVLVALYVLKANAIIIPTAVLVFAWIIWAVQILLKLIKGIFELGLKVGGKKE